MDFKALKIDVQVLKNQVHYGAKILKFSLLVNSCFGISI